MNIVVIHFKSFIFIHTGCNSDQNIFIKRTTVSKTFSPKHALLLKLKNKALELSRISPIMNHPDVIKTNSCNLQIGQYSYGNISTWIPSKEMLNYKETCKIQFLLVKMFHLA